LIRLIHDQVASGFDPDEVAHEVRQAAELRLGQATATLGARHGDIEVFRRALDRAQAAYPVREDNEFFTISLPLGVTRIAALELGRRLAQRGQTDTRDDVFFLELTEARQALESGDSRHSLVGRRKGELAWVKAHPGPGSYGTDPGPPPSFAALPAEARFVMEALLWGVDRAFETERSAQRQRGGKEPITGVAASPGSYTGPARIVMDESQFGKIQPGDVLVCPITSPVWSVLFPSLGALISDTGGILSHPAIIAREYQIPAVVAVGNATQILTDDQLVTVDGSAGVVEHQASKR
jgi:pyruvate,water dikinase